MIIKYLQKQITFIFFWMHSVGLLLSETIVSMSRQGWMRACYDWRLNKQWFWQFTESSTWVRWIQHFSFRNLINKSDDENKHREKLKYVDIASVLPKLKIMKFVVDLVSKHSGRIGTLTKSDFELKTPLVLHYTRVTIVVIMLWSNFQLEFDAIIGIFFFRLVRFHTWAEKYLICWRRRSKAFKYQSKQQVRLKKLSLFFKKAFPHLLA